MSAPPTPSRNRLGLARQLWLLLLVPTVLVLGVYGLLADMNRHSVLMTEASVELRNHANLIESTLGGPVERGQLDLFKNRLKDLTRSGRAVGLAAFDAEINPILLTGVIAPASSDLEALARRALAAETFIEEQGKIAGRTTLMRTIKLAPRTGEPAVIVIVVHDLLPMEILGRALNRGLVLTGGALVAITAVVAAFVSRATVGRPARAILEGAERVSAGDLGAKVPEWGAEELAQLARAFNAMTASLGRARARAEREEAARVAVERRLQRAQALAAVGQVAASIGHEIGSPLNVILGRARRAAEKEGCPEAIKGELETIAVQSERISRVVARLLAVARPSDEAIDQGSDLVQVVTEALAFLAPECRQRRIQTRFDPPADAGGPLRVALDADRLFQVVFNLCLNAVQAQDKGGEIAVRVLPPGKKVVFEVEDKGPGVPAELAPHVFDAFVTSKGDRGGTGLGLTIVSGIVREAGGAVELVPGAGGACFRVSIPAEARRARPAPRLEAAS